MKLVFSSSADVCHAYAQQNQPEGKNTGRSIFFYKEKIYSYGHHFCMAKFINQNLFFTLRSYSNSTAKHLSKLHHATKQYNKIYCAYPDGTPKENFKYWEAEALTQVNKLQKAKKPEIYLNNLSGINNQLQKYCEALEIAPDQKLADLLAITDKEEFKALAERRAAQAIEELKAKEKEAKRKFKDGLKKWLNNESDYLHSRLNLDFLRLKNGRVETTQDVKIPVQIALKLWQNIKDNSLKIGDEILNYSINKITDRQIIIGCHTFNKAYLLKFGANLAANI